VTQGKKFITLLALVASATALLGLIPVAFALPLIAAPVFPLGTALFFVLVLGGPLLLLASAFHNIATGSSRLLFLIGFTVVVMSGGFLFSMRVPKLWLDWITMSVAISLIAAMLRTTWLWALVGGVWAGGVLGVLVLASTREFLSPTTGGGFPKWAPVWLLDCVLALLSSLVTFLRRHPTEPHST
jgi:hypothetical protein